MKYASHSSFVGLLALSAFTALLYMSSMASAAETAPPVVKEFSAGTGASEGQGIAVAADGTIFATGQYGGTGTFGSFSLTNGGATDYFLAAYQPSGTVKWAVRAGLTGSDFGSDVIVDNAGNVIVAGVIQGNCDFHGVTNVTGFGKKDWFLAKYSPAGTLLWVRLAGSAEDDQIYDVAEDGSGNYFIGGRVNGVATFGTFTAGSNGQTRLVLAKYDSNGQALWVRDVCPAGSTETAGVAADSAGNGYITSLNATFNTGGPVVAKYNSAGTQQWIETATTGNTFFDEGSSVDVDSSGNVYVAGRYGALSIDFGNGVTQSNPNGKILGFIAKYNSDGNAQWVKAAGGRAFDLDVQADGTLYAIGFFTATETVANKVGTETLVPVGSGLEAWIAKLTSAGDVTWVTVGGTSSSDIGRAINLAPSGNLYGIGEGGAGLFGISTYGGNVFIAELNEANQPPRLEISLVGANTRLSWPAAFQGYSIISSGVAGSGYTTPQVTFTPVAGQPNTFNTPKPSTNIFFRLEAVSQ